MKRKKMQNDNFYGGFFFSKNKVQRYNDELKLAEQNI